MSDIFRQENKETSISDDTRMMEGLPCLRPHRGHLVFWLGSLWVIMGSVTVSFREKLPPGLIGGAWVAGLILGILAWIIGAHDLREMKNQKMDPAGKRMTHFGMAWGSIMVIMTIVVAAAMLIGMLILPRRGN